MKVPFHKQLDPNKQAGQIVNPIPEQFLHQSHKQETTLAQYIERKTGAITDCDIPKKITFDEWWKKYDGGPDYSNTGIAESAAEDIWNAALTRGKVS